MREGYYSEQIRNDAFAHVDLNKKQFQVLEVIEKFQPISNEGIAKHLGVPMHTVTPRVLELRQKEVVEFCGEGISASNRRISLWRINKDFYQLKLF